MDLVPWVEKAKFLKSSHIAETQKTELLLESLLAHIIEHFVDVDAHALINFIRDLFSSCRDSPPPPVNKQEK